MPGCVGLPWEQRLWPPPTLRGPQLPEDVFVRLGSVNDYVYETAVRSHHTNPSLFARHKQTGARVLVKLRLSDRGAREYAEHSRISIVRLDGHPEVAGSTGSIFSEQWATCDRATCPEAAAALGANATSRLRRVPSPGAALARLQVAAGVGSLRDELFFHALLSRGGVCPAKASGIPGLADVLEFSPRGGTPSAIWRLATGLLGEGAAPPPARGRYIYGLVFQRLDAAPPHTLHVDHVGSVLRGPSAQ